MASTSPCVELMSIYRLNFNVHVFGYSFTGLFSTDWLR